MSRLAISFEDVQRLAPTPGHYWVRLRSIPIPDGRWRPLTDKERGAEWWVVAELSLIDGARVWFEPEDNVVAVGDAYWTGFEIAGPIPEPPDEATLADLGADPDDREAIDLRVRADLRLRAMPGKAGEDSGPEDGLADHRVGHARDRVRHTHVVVDDGRAVSHAQAVPFISQPSFSASMPQRPSSPWRKCASSQ